MGFSFHVISREGILESSPLKEHYYREKSVPCNCHSQRIMAVVDMQTAIIGGYESNDIFLGLFSSNSLFTKLVAEHIHNDIYLARLEEQQQKNPIDEGVLIRTFHESKPTNTTS